MPTVAGADEWLCFEACVAEGSLRLRLCAPIPCNAAVAAIALDDSDELLQAIDAWLAMELDWKRSPGGERISALCALAACDASAGRPEGDADADAFGRCWLEVPWLLLRTVRPPPPALARRLRWQDMTAQLTLSTLFLDDMELSAIEPGGAVVLPESMGAGWACRLHVPDEAPERGVAVAVQTAGAPARGTDSAGPPSPAPLPSGGASICRVLLPIPRPLGAFFLAGWSAPPLSVDDLAKRRSELWLMPPGTRAPPRRIAAGSLIPWGQGCALLIDERQ